MNEIEMNILLILELNDKNDKGKINYLSTILSQATFTNNNNYNKRLSDMHPFTLI